MAWCRNLGRERQSFPPASSGISRAEDHLLQSLSSLAGCSPAIYLTRHKPHLSLDISHSGQLHTQNRIHLCPASCSDPRHICTTGQSRTEAHGLTAFGLPVGPAVIHTACQAPLCAEGLGVGSLHSLRASLLQRQASCQGQARAHPVSGQ